ncbi:ABC transporter substrate-binding protein [Micromonospora sp. STR1s_5]|nr:ABC transporter substrate-binding protein [Micromonospora sp. STR1s_5]
MSIRSLLIAAAAGLGLGIPVAHAQTGTPLTIGVLTDTSGVFTDVSGRGSITAAEMAIEDFGGTVLGRPIRLISADHQNKPDVGAGIARKWFDEDGVTAIFDLPTSAVALAVQHLAHEKNKITVISSASTDIATNAQCSPTGAHWTYDSYSVGKVLAEALAKPGSKWFFAVVDNVGGATLQNSATPFLEAAGAKIVGAVRHPQNTADMSSFILGAQTSGADFVAMGNAGVDLITFVKQWREFGLSGKDQTLVGIVLFLTDLGAIGLQDGQGLTYVTGFTSEASPEAAEWSKRFIERHGKGPNDSQAGVYSAVSHYLKAVKDAGTTDTAAVMPKMRELPVEDMFTKHGVLRPDGRMMHDMYLVKAKAPSESKGPWDLVSLVKTIPAKDAFRPLEKSGCPLVRKQAN